MAMAARRIEFPRISGHRGPISISISISISPDRAEPAMCRNIKPLFNFEPPATDDEIRVASLQFVRKLSGFNAPSVANTIAFNRAVDDITKTARKLIDSLTTNAQPRDREVEANKARERSRARFAAPG
jgi:hypothetical protein